MYLLGAGAASLHGEGAALHSDTLLGSHDGGANHESRHSADARRER